MDKRELDPAAEVSGRPITDPQAVLLRERARQLAAVRTQAGSEAEVEVMLFCLGNEQYAVDLASLQAVHGVQGLTALPCTPAFIAGILNVRGEIVTVLNLGLALGLPGTTELSEGAKVLLTALSAVRCGLLVDDVIGVSSLRLDQLAPPLSGREAVRGIADGHILLLNLEHLLLNGQFEVFEDVT